MEISQKRGSKERMLFRKLKKNSKIRALTLYSLCAMWRLDRNIQLDYFESWSLFYLTLLYLVSLSPPYVSLGVVMIDDDEFSFKQLF
jgi:hypothetical protein